VITAGGGNGGNVTLNKDIGVKEVIAIFALISVIYAGMEGISRIAGREATKQINQHSIVTEANHAEQYNQIMFEQARVRTDVAVTKKQIDSIGEDVKEIKEILKDQ
jgi:hypothetical protein